MNHDALFKMLLKRPAILKGFFEAFLPQTARFINFSRLEFIDKERVTIDGRKRSGDLIVKTQFRNKAAGFLIHLEHQAQPDQDLGRRMLEYWLLDWREYNPIAVLSHRRALPECHPPLEIRFPNKRILHFDFDVIDLPRMKARYFLKLENPAALALAARMKMDPQDCLRCTRDFFLGLARTDCTREDQELVAGFFSAYRPLSAEHTLQLEAELGKVNPKAAREVVMELTNPFIELGKLRGRKEGRQQGRQEGFVAGQAELVLKLLHRRIGVRSSAQETAIRKLSAAKMAALGEALLDFSSPADLARWLKKNIRKKNAA